MEVTHGVWSGQKCRDWKFTVQVLVYFAVAKMGASPIDGKTDVDPEGLTAATGKHAAAFAARLAAGGLSCKVKGREYRFGGRPAL